VIRNLVPVKTASRSERSANRSLYQGNCARAGFLLLVRAFPLTNAAFVYAMLTCENIVRAENLFQVMRAGDIH
jgi:hypothetical protein